MDREVVTVVSGLPRSGTSMLMKMLEAGGIEPLTDNVRTADVDNPKGYFEFERVKRLPEDTAWLPEAKGKAVKVLAELVTKLPEGYEYKIIFIRRNINEILASQKKMVVRRGGDPDAVSDEELRQLFNKYLGILRSWIEGQPNVDVLYVNYNEIMMDPAEAIAAIDEFMGGDMDTEAMREAVDSELYRNRA
ncbi:MAG: sulfotransferase domain-containing protein [Thermoplasmata archaeon]|nr:sulfotransferase domain-containing protein [Thermoplasmata archaeon]